MRRLRGEEIWEKSTLGSWNGLWAKFLTWAGELSRKPLTVPINDLYVSAFAVLWSHQLSMASWRLYFCYQWQMIVKYNNNNSSMITYRDVNLEGSTRNILSSPADNLKKVYQRVLCRTRRNSRRDDTLALTVKSACDRLINTSAD